MSDSSRNSRAMSSDPSTGNADSHCHFIIIIPFKRRSGSGSSHCTYRLYKVFESLILLLLEQRLHLCRHLLWMNHSPSPLQIALIQSPIVLLVPPVTMVASVIDLNLVLVYLPLPSAIPLCRLGSTSSELYGPSHVRRLSWWSRILIDRTVFAKGWMGAVSGW